MTRRIAVELMLLLAAIALAFALRLYVFGIYQIPSESMVPRLLAGDIVLVDKRHFSRGTTLPARGDIIVFHAPPRGKVDYVKRVIGLPGDSVALRDGVVILNGQPLPRRRIPDLVLPGPHCPMPLERRPDGSLACRYYRYVETMPDGTSHVLLDIGLTEGDDYGPVRVPPGRLFLMGDNRDLSADSRLPAGVRGGIGLVPASTVVGRARMILFSFDSMDQSVRWSRTGMRF